MRSYRPKINTKNGFSLLELILAISIFALGSFATSYLIIDANTTARIAFDNSDAITHAKDGLEALMGIRNSDFDDLIDSVESFGCNIISDPCGVNTTNLVWAVSASPTVSGKYTRGFVLEPDVDDTATTTSSASSTVTVSWTGPREDAQEISLSTILTKWRYVHDIPIEE